MLKFVSSILLGKQQGTKICIIVVKIYATPSYGIQHFIALLVAVK